MQASFGKQVQAMFKPTQAKPVDFAGFVAANCRLGFLTAVGAVVGLTAMGLNLKANAPAKPPLSPSAYATMLLPSLK